MDTKLDTNQVRKQTSINYFQNSTMLGKSLENQVIVKVFIFKQYIDSRRNK